MLARRVRAGRPLPPGHLAPHHDAGREDETRDQAEDGPEDDELAPPEAELVMRTA
jgi:hypothetical protein